MHKGQRAGYSFGRWDVVQLLLGDDAYRSLPVAEIMAGGDVQQETRHQRAKEKSEDIVLFVTRSGRCMHMIFDQHQVESLMSLEGSTWWPVIARKAHCRLCMSVVLQGLWF